MSNDDASLQAKLNTAAALLHSARYAIALTGAGISTSSGIPDFRSPKSGLWQHVDPMEVASAIGFRLSPEKFFSWIRPLARLFLNAAPNSAHFALAQLEEMGILKGIITQNIDMLHSKAGSRKLYEVHGHLREATCVECFRVYQAGDYLERFVESGELPQCPVCHGLLKPNVILYGEQMPFQVLQDAQRAARECDVMLIVGSSLTVAPAASLPQVAIAHGAELIIINYEETYLDTAASVVIHDNVAGILPRLASLLEGEADL